MGAFLNRRIVAGLWGTVIALVFPSFLLADKPADDASTDGPLAARETPYLPRLVASPARYVGVREYIEWEPEKRQVYLMGACDGFVAVLNEVEAIANHESPPDLPEGHEPVSPEWWQKSTAAERWNFANELGPFKAFGLASREGPMKDTTLDDLTGDIQLNLSFDSASPESMAAIAWRVLTEDQPAEIRYLATEVGGRFVAAENVDLTNLRTYLAGFLDGLQAVAGEWQAIRLSEVPPPLPSGADPIDFQTWQDTSLDDRSNFAARLAIVRLDYAARRDGLMTGLDVSALERITVRHFESTRRWDGEYGERSGALAAWQAFVRYEPDPSSPK